MKEFKNAKKTYENIEIPKELDAVVQNALQQSAKRKKSGKVTAFYKITISIAATVLIAITIALNTSESFAMEMKELPIIGSLAKVLTIRSYEKSDETKKIAVKIPAVSEETPLPLITDVNAEIERVSNNYIEEAEIRAEEYKQAFLETGGTEEEWLEHNIEIKVDYEIKSQTERYLSFVLYGTESWVGAYAQTIFYNLDMLTGEAVTLKDILGEDYITIANESILSQMNERLAADKDLTYFDDSMDGFQSISQDTKFYLNESGNPVIVFDKYEIAPGAFGPQEFEIIPV